VQPPVVGLGCVIDVTIVLELTPFAREVVGFAAGVPAVAVTAEPTLPATPSEPPEITAGPGAT
jgi:hypothetical protein